MDSVLYLLEAMYSKEGLFLIHVDKKNAILQSELEKKIKSHSFINTTYHNVFIMKNSFYLQWGSSSIVFAQLEGFYQMLDLGDWDYIINLSAYDYPLYSTNAIHKHLLSVISIL